jgi:hypothetical protein
VDDHLLGEHRVLLFHRYGRSGEAKRNEGRQATVSVRFRSGSWRRPRTS